jgi:hypothetical protein
MNKTAAEVSLPRQRIIEDMRTRKLKPTTETAASAPSAN